MRPEIWDYLERKKAEQQAQAGADPGAMPAPVTTGEVNQGPSKAQLFAQAFAGLGDAISARAGNKTNFLGGAQAALESNRQEQQKISERAADRADKKVLQEKQTAETNKINAEMDASASKRDPASAGSRAAQKVYGGMLVKVGYKPEQIAMMAEDDIKNAMSSGTTLYNAEQTRIANTDSKNLAQQAKEDAAKEKADLEAKESVIPGWKSDGNVRIEGIEARKLRDGMASYDSFTSNLKAYKKLINDYGTSEVMNQGVRGEMNGLAKALQLDLKNMAQLGVLSAADIPFMEEQIPKPGFLQTEAGMQGALGSTNKSMKRNILARMKARGYAPEKPEDYAIEEAVGTAAPSETAQEPLRRKYKGRVALFDPVSKAFIRYED